MVEKALRLDPSGVYPRMDFVTRDRYRHAVESIARRSALSEAEVAQAAVRLAEEAARNNRDADKPAHVGYYLIGQGPAVLERTAKARTPFRTIAEHLIQRFPLSYYQGGIFLITFLITTEFVRESWSLGAQGWKLAVLTRHLHDRGEPAGRGPDELAFDPLVRPRLLPRLDFANGIAPEARTMVVVPTLLTSLEDVDRLIETMEIHHLANRDRNLHFALLTDFRDAALETMPQDEPLLARARAGIVELNQRYGSDKNSLFFLFHRPRRWNASEGAWMGYERKRGKLTDFNALLRGGARDSFSEIVGDTSILPGVKYVITLDTDTQLPRDAARQLAGTMAHRLNRPDFDPEHGLVGEGYSILQPRVGVSLPSAGRSWFVAPLRRRCGHRPLHAGGFRRLPGPVSGGLLHREGHL